MSYYTVYLEGDLAERLREIAHAERRRPRDQASVLLIAAIRRVSAEQAGEGDTSPTDTQPDGPMTGPRRHRRSDSRRNQP